MRIIEKAKHQAIVRTGTTGTGSSNPPRKIFSTSSVGSKVTAAATPLGGGSHRASNLHNRSSSSWIIRQPIPAIKEKKSSYQPRLQRITLLSQQVECKIQHAPSPLISNIAKASLRSATSSSVSSRSAILLETDYRYGTIVNALLLLLVLASRSKCMIAFAAYNCWC